ncbi:MAG: helix-turn-helix domain-containing protein [Streptosporangiales bacterium]|nr:helix-turn-helix domain-containing protein [Streptosporangiales bacterium]
MAEKYGKVSGDSPSPTAPRVILGGQLRGFREAAGVTMDEAAHRIRASRSKLSRMENGRVSIKERDIEDLLTLYGVTDAEARSGVLSLVGLANAVGWWDRYDDVLPDWFEPYLGLESASCLIRCFELQFVPGLFQTVDYARAVALLGPGMVPGDELDRRVSLRVKRQDLLTRPGPPRIWAVLDEGVLRRPLGGRAVMRAQIGRLLEVADLPNVTLQVVPFGRGGHAAAGGSFSMLRFADPGVPDMVYAEQLASAVYFDKESDVDLYAGVMDRLGAKALIPAQTRSFLTRIRDET